MSHRFSKGKGKRPASPAQSSENDSADNDQHMPLKRLRQSSTERIQATAIAKVAPVALSSSSKGLSGFGALIASRTNLSSAALETNRGLKGGKAGRFASRASSQSKALVKTVEVEGITVGTIVFIVVGVMENEIEDPADTSLFRPVYRLCSDVDISPMALTGMKQAGLCVMKDVGFEFLSTDTYGIIDNKLAALFPKLYDWLVEDDLVGQTTSWLICMKPPHRKSLVVYTDDSNLPSGYDIMRACTMARSKAGVQDRILYIATRNPVPSDVVQGWRPKATSSRIDIGGLDHQGSNHGKADTNDGEVDTDGEEVDQLDSSSDFPSSPTCLLFRNQQLRRSNRFKNRADTDAETEVISISDDSESLDSAQDEAMGDPLTDPATPPPPQIDDFNVSFASIDFTGKDNPWN